MKKKITDCVRPMTFMEQALYGIAEREKRCKERSIQLSALFQELSKVELSEEASEALERIVDCWCSHNYL